MKKLIVFCLLFATTRLHSQNPAYRMGDIALGINYGAPQITPAILRATLNAYYKSRWADEDFSFKISNTGVLNGKAEYAVHEDLSLGFVASYWNMGVDLDYTYDRDANGTPLQDHYRFGMSALAMGLRGNYHFFTEKEYEHIDPYYGAAVGLTKYDYNVKFSSDDDTHTLPQETFKWRTGYLTYFATTFGLRIYPVNFLAINLEAGWDRGAFLFGGLVFKMHTKPPKFLLDN